MKKFFLLPVILLAVVFCTLNGCKKDENPNVDGKFDVSFNINSISENGGGQKSSLDLPPCSELRATEAKITLQGPDYPTPTEVTLDVSYIGDYPITKGLKLSPGTYTVKEFLMYNKSLDAGVETLLSATPHLGSTYASYLSSSMRAIDLSFTVSKFEKNEITMEVICYIPEVYTDFGFVYFKIDEIVIREKYFFGDLCIKDLNDYLNTPYVGQPDGLKYDLTAIFKIKVTRIHEGNSQSWEYSNEEWLGVRQPLKVLYADFENSVDNFKFELFVLVKKGDATEFKKFEEWNFNDVSDIISGDDNIVDFVVGNCVQSTTDYHFEPYMNLPNTCSMSVTLPSDEAYMDATLSNFIPSGSYDIPEGVSPVFCVDKNHFITPGVTYNNIGVFSSLYLSEIPDGLFAKTVRWDRLNWLINNLDLFPGCTWEQQQAAIWKETNNWEGPSQGGISYDVVAQDMHDQMVTFGDNFSPLPGGWAFVIFTSANGAIQAQGLKIDQ